MILIVFFLLTLAFLFAFMRTIQGPTLVDRAAGADVMTASLAAMLITLAWVSPGARYFFDLAILLLGAAFLGVIFLAKMHQQGESKED